MLTINKLIPQGKGLAPALLKRAAAVVLDWDTRQKSRLKKLSRSNTTEQSILIGFTEANLLLRGFHFRLLQPFRVNPLNSAG